MVYSVIHKTTNEIRSGQWDSENLNFISKDGNIGWDDYHHWEPYEKPVIVAQIKPKQVILSIYNHILFMDVDVRTKSGQRINLSVPLKYYRHNTHFLEFKPFYGKLNFDRCSFYGKVHGRIIQVYQLPEGKHYEKMANFMIIKRRLCEVCLGLDQHLCQQCHKSI